ncbi:MAG: hypothetical protein R3C39_01570 [Dehalococcoidia bacterium]
MSDLRVRGLQPRLHLGLAGGVAALAAAVAIFSLGGIAGAQEATTLEADLGALNDSGASGTATIEVNGSEMTVTVDVSGVSPDQAHAQHIHIGGENACPTTADDADGDGLISTAEGQPRYGAVQVALTTDGDSAAGSALAVDRFPTAGSDGSYTYERTLEMPSSMSADDFANGVVVVHGYAELGGDDAAYDGDAPSSLDAGLPLEATLPVLCGTLASSQQGTPTPTATASPTGTASPTATSSPGTGSGSGSASPTPSGGVNAGFGGDAGSSSGLSTGWMLASIAIVAAGATGLALGRRRG